jgi:hypothetical protein
LATSTSFATDRADPLDEGQLSRDVIALATGERCSRRREFTTT